MGNKISKSYKEQENAIKNGEISFDLNIYFIGEKASYIYQNFCNLKQNDKSGVFCYWNYFYHNGEYSEQVKEMSNLFTKKQELFEKDPEKNTFKEVIVIYMKERDEQKIDEIFQNFAGGKHDVFCPFIIFFFECQENEPKQVVPEEENYYISPLKVFTFKFDTPNSEPLRQFNKCLFRICSYFNELGDQFFIWNKDSDEPIVYDLVNCDFNAYINIFCLGKTGSGKSTFLNKFFRAKKSKQGGTGRSTTTKIVRFGIDNIPIRIYDIPGFEDEETIEKVNNKLIQAATDMTSDRDKIHLILYFINNKEETMVYKMEKKIIDTLKENNKDVRIIFILTHSIIDPYSIQDEKKVKQRRKVDIVKDKVRKAINVISSAFGDSYGYNYFEKDSLTQKNLIFVNLEKDYESDREPFGFDKVIQSIYSTISEGNDVNQLNLFNQKIAVALINKVKNDDKLNNEIKEFLSKGYLLKHISFDVQKEKAFKEAQKLYDGMFSIGKTLLTISPFWRDVKLGIIKYQKYQFKKKLNKIFGFNIESKGFDYNPNETDYEKLNREQIEKMDNKDNFAKKQDLIKDIRKEYNANEVSSGWIIGNEVVGAICFGCLFGGPILLPIGAVGLAGSSYISFKTFKDDCTEYFEQYKKHYEEYKYYSIFNFINSIKLGMIYMEKYIISLDDQAAPQVDNILDSFKRSIEDNIKTAEGTEKKQVNESEITSNIPFLN